MTLVLVRSVFMSVALVASLAAPNASASICALAKAPLGLLPFVVEQVPNKDDVTELQADFDGDGREDRLLWLPQTAGSSMPADYAAATLILAAGERPLVLEEAFISVLKYKRHYYVATTSLADEQHARTNSVYSIGRKGFRRMCTFITRLNENR